MKCKGNLCRLKFKLRIKHLLVLSFFLLFFFIISIWQHMESHEKFYLKKQKKKEEEQIFAHTCAGWGIKSLYVTRVKINYIWFVFLFFFLYLPRIGIKFQQFLWNFNCDFKKNISDELF